MIWVRVSHGLVNVCVRVWIRIQVMVLGKDWAKVREVWIMVGQGFGWV